MTTLTRSQLLPFFDLRREINFAHHAQTEIVRAYDATDQAALVEKKYSGTLSNLQIRENELLFAVSQHEVDGVQLTARIAALRRYSKHSVQGSHEILVKWYGFDLDDWYTLLSGTPGNPFHQARFLLELVRAALKALHLLHAAGFVHADVHNGNWCLPFTGAALEPDGSALRCTLDPDALKLIDLGLSLKPAEERGLPPRLYSAAGGVGEVIALNDRATPAHPRRLVDALDRARLGDLAPWQALDWRLDLWRLGALIDLWRDTAGEAEGLTGAKTLRVLLADLADTLKKPEQQALAGAALPTKLPHGNWVAAITAAIGQPQPLAVSLPLQPAEARSLAALAPKIAPSPKPSPVPSPAPVPAPVPTPGGPRRAWRMVPLVMALGLGLAGAWWWTARPRPVESEQATPSSPPQLAVPAPAAAPAMAGPAGARSEAYPAGPVMVNLPQIAGNATGTLLGQADGGEGDEKPPYRVRMPYQLAMGETAVTFTQWDLCVSEGGCQHKPSDNGWGRGERPVINVNWHDAQEYLLWLNRKAGLDPKAADRYRLPTEAERELAARAGNDGEFSLGPNNDKRLGPQTANFNATQEYRGSATGEYRQKTVPVKASPFQPNAWGLWQMHGNVWEWTQDCYDSGEYKKRAEASGGWLASQSSAEKADCWRVLRGGSWGNFPQNLRSAVRGSSSSGVRSDYFGFRLARTLP